MTNTEQEQDRILTKIAKEMADSIDKELLWGMLVKAGWTRVILPSLSSRDSCVMLPLWLDEYCKDAYKRGGSEIIFKSSKDANWFTLRWGCK